MAVDKGRDLRHKTEAILLKLALGKSRLMAKASFLTGFVQNRIKATPSKKNRASISRHLPVITLCATCGNALKNEYPKIIGTDYNRNRCGKHERHLTVLNHW